MNQNKPFDQNLRENHLLGEKLPLLKSMQLWSKAERIIPGGSQTASKAPGQFVKGVYPMFLQSGAGCHVTDVDGNVYLDYPSGLGAVILGYGYPKVAQAVERQLKDGVLFSLPHPLEAELAELLVKHILCAEMVRFMKNGSDVTSAAVRLARAYTGREKIAACGYHGWQDWYVISTDKKKGVPAVLEEYIFKFSYNSIASLTKIFQENPGKIAAVIMEPVVTEKPTDSFLQQVKEVTHAAGAVLIFDEMVTGFRFGLGGAQQYFRVTPDIGCFGKSVANGMPLSILAGKKDIMALCLDPGLFMSTTFGGEVASLAAAIATIQEIEEKNVVDHIWNSGRKLQEGYNQCAKELGLNSACVGFPARLNLTFKDKAGIDSPEMKSVFLQETIQRGILIGNVIFCNYSHSTEDIDETLNACKEALQIVKLGLDAGNLSQLLQGEVAGEVFRRQAER